MKDIYNILNVNLENKGYYQKRYANFLLDNEEVLKSKYSKRLIEIVANAIGVYYQSSYAYDIASSQIALKSDAVVKLTEFVANCNNIELAKCVSKLANIELILESGYIFYIIDILTDAIKYQSDEIKYEERLLPYNIKEYVYILYEVEDHIQIENIYEALKYELSKLKNNNKVLSRIK